MSHAPPPTPSIELEPDEALVLFEFLQRFREAGSLSIDDPAEQGALWHLGCLLERQSLAPSVSHCRALLAGARDRPRDQA